MTKELHKENFNRNQIERLVKMTEEEWRETLLSLCDNCEFDKMWQLAQKAPPVWSRELLQELGQVKWSPSWEGEREVFQKLLWLAENCVEEVPKLGGLVSCQKVLKGHSNSVSSLAISPDVKIFATSGRNLDSTVRLWGLPDGQHLRTLRGYSVSAYSLAISPDGKILASGNYNDTVRLWRLPDGQRLRTLKGHSDTVTILAISPDSKILASGGGVDKTVRLWRLPDGKHLRTLKGHSYGVNFLAFSPDGKILASGGENIVRLWQLPDGKHLCTLTEHSHLVYSLAISPDGKILASGSRDKTVRLWRLPDGKHLRTLKGHSYGVSSLAFSPDGKILASGGGDRTVRLWGLPDGKHLCTLKGHSDSVWSLAISPDGKILVSGSRQNGTLRLWTSELPRVTALPLEQLTPEDIKWVQGALENKNITEDERHWLEFILELIRWEQRFDIEIEIDDPESRENPVEFDIEIEG